MGRLYIKAAECNNKEHDRQLKEKFIKGTDNEKIKQEMIKELTAHRNMREIDIEHVLMWAHRFELQRVEKNV